MEYKLENDRLRSHIHMGHGTNSSAGERNTSHVHHDLTLAMTKGLLVGFPDCSALPIQGLRKSLNIKLNCPLFLLGFEFFQNRQVSRGRFLTTAHYSCHSFFYKPSYRGPNPYTDFR